MFAPDWFDQIAEALGELGGGVRDEQRALLTECVGYIDRQIPSDQ